MYKNTPFRLVKFVAHAGNVSRRRAVELIKQGTVKVNCKVVIEPWLQVETTDTVVVDEKKISLPETYQYIVLNKPMGVVTSRSDEKGRITVIDQLGISKKLKIVPVGRLDLPTTGILLLTNDGELVQTLTHPKYKVKKTYAVFLDQPVRMSDIITLKKGVLLSDGMVSVDNVHLPSRKNMRKIQVSLHSGKQRVIRRMLNKLGYSVVKLDRIRFAGIGKKGLPVGQWRHLNTAEVLQLRAVGSSFVRNP